MVPRQTDLEFYGKTLIITPLTKLGELGSELVHICFFKVENRTAGWWWFQNMLLSWGFYKKYIKSCHLKAVNSFIKWYHANSRFGLASNLLLKPFYLTRDFDIFFCCHWLYLGTFDSFLSISDTITWKLMFSCLFQGKC